MKEPIKKSWYKRWWGIFLIVLVGLLVIGYIFDDTKEKYRENIKNNIETLEQNSKYMFISFSAGSNPEQSIESLKLIEERIRLLSEELPEEDNIFIYSRLLPVILRRHAIERYQIHKDLSLVCIKVIT